MVVDSASLAGRALDNIEEVARISSGSPGVTRIAYTREDALGRAWFKARCERYGLRFEVDPIGNCYGWTPPARSRRPLLVGSHLDSVPTAGRYDGVVGVMVGLELARWVTECELDLPIVAVSFACEESTRFGFGTVGSGWLVGEMALEGPMMLLDRQGAPLADVVAQASIEEVGPVVERRVEDFLGLLEVHIDQGTILTSLGAHAGVVDTIWGVDRVELTWSGQAAHSGGRWREDRRDALLAACDFVVAADTWWSAVDPAGRQLQLTIGSLRVEPNSPNTVAGTATSILDVRAPSLETIVRSAQEVVGLAEAHATSRNVAVSTRHLGRSRPLEVDHALAGILKAAASRGGHPLPNVPSLAGHDSLVIGRHAPTAMILIANPTGISHSPQEDLDPEGLEQAFSVMVDALPATIENLSGR